MQLKTPAPIFVVAGETSGDRLAASLIDALRRKRADLRFIGIGGPLMQRAGCDLIASSEELAVMGLVEVLAHLPRLIQLKRRARRAAKDSGCHFFIGVDAPEFNLSLAKTLHADGLGCVQYVSPQVWAWRSGRVVPMSRYLKHVLCLLPFEAPFYQKARLPATFVGHPLADRLPVDPNRETALNALGLSRSQQRIVALLPGSRVGEVKRLIEVFLDTMGVLQNQFGSLKVLIPVANPHVRPLIEAAVAKQADRFDVQLFDGQSSDVLQAAEVALVASGTATLETLLCRCPMVVAYRAAPLTAWLLKHLGLMKARFFSQPNLLAGERVVEEWFQDDVTPERLADGLAEWLKHPEKAAELRERFRQIHLSLKRDASQQAARVVLSLLDELEPPSAL